MWRAQCCATARRITAGQGGGRQRPWCPLPSSDLLLVPYQASASSLLQQASVSAIHEVSKVETHLRVTSGHGLGSAAVVMVLNDTYRAFMSAQNSCTAYNTHLHKRVYRPQAKRAQRLRAQVILHDIDK
jgi:hypothetical protein